MFAYLQLKHTENQYFKFFTFKIALENNTII